ncbi:hypothetical protein [Nostoc sp. NMS8]|uniref:hypothetical protein n=1 Tax=Nostoc sp. NMS8 TaxID=2815392 RepID=UPI0025ED3B7A|nr:hypothetical protein [Nostoc sp. NMS8]MBN3958000.1 hypothetical protein [Nostoc sp. NMS8]
MSIESQGAHQLGELKFFMFFFADTENPELGKIRCIAGVAGADCNFLGYQCKVSMPVPATTESSAAFPSCFNLPNPSFLLAIA